MTIIALKEQNVKLVIFIILPQSYILFCTIQGNNGFISDR